MTRRLTKKEMWIFAIGQMGWSILGGIINAWLVTFYLPTKGDIDAGAFQFIKPGFIVMGLTILGIIAAICRIFDAVTDPLIASLSDSSKNPKGRRIPFMRRAAVPFAVTTIIVFCAPVQKISHINAAWVLGFLILFYLFMTMYCTPYNALISEFGKTQEDRMYISTAISLTYFAGMMLSYTPFVFAGMLRSVVNNFNMSYRLCFVALSAIALICMLIPTLLLNENDFVDAKPTESNMMQSLGATFKNKSFRIFVCSDITYFLGMTLFQTGLPFFVKVSMKLDESLTMVFMGSMAILSACLYPIVSKLVAKFGKKNLVITGFIGLGLAYFITALIGIIPVQSDGSAGVPGIIFGVAVVLISAFPMALLGIIPQAIVADIAEQESITTGENRQGMFFAARTFAMKFGTSAAMLMFTSLAILGSHHAGSSTDIVATEFGLRVVAIVAVCSCSLGAFILSLYNEKNVMKTLADAHAAKNA